jgi:NDP-sugar pyrophosphorylase family protein
MTKRAVLIATGSCTEGGVFVRKPPFELVPFFDRPFLHGVVERLAEAGITKIDLIVGERPEVLEREVGDGSRWGLNITYHLVRDSDRRYRALRALRPDCPERRVLVAHADALPDLKSLRILLSHVGPNPAAITALPGAPAGARSDGWIGWVNLPWDMLMRVPKGLLQSELAPWVAHQADGEVRHVESAFVFGVRTSREYLESHRLALSRQFREGPLVSGVAMPTGLRLAPSARIHPSVSIRPPAYIGRDCMIAEGVEVGPHAVIGSGCIIGRDSHIEHSVVRPGAYVGENLAIQQSVVDGEWLASVRHGVAVEVRDKLLLGAVAKHRLRSAVLGLAERAIAGLLLVAASPILLATALGLRVCCGRPVLHRPEVVRVPGNDRAGDVSTFRLFTFDPRYGRERLRRRGGPISDLLVRILPGLVNVVRGEMHFVGTEPRSPSIFFSLPEAWRQTYARARAGLITEAEVRMGSSPCDEDLYAAEVWSADHANWRDRSKLLWSYFLTRVTPSGRSRRQEVVTA